MFKVGLLSRSTYFNSTNPTYILSVDATILHVFPRTLMLSMLMSLAGPNSCPRGEAFAYSGRGRDGQQHIPSSRSKTSGGRSHRNKIWGKSLRNSGSDTLLLARNLWNRVSLSRTCTAFTTWIMTLVLCGAGPGPVRRNQRASRGCITRLMATSSSSFQVSFRVS